MKIFNYPSWDFLHQRIRFLKFGFLAMAVASQAESVELKYMAHQDFDTAKKFKKSKIGGLSAIVPDDESPNSYFVVSDDRGNLNEPRFYKFNIFFREQPISEDISSSKKAVEVGNAQKGKQTQTVRENVNNSIKKPANKTEETSVAETFSNNKLIVEPVSVHWLKYDLSRLSHQPQLTSAQKFSEVLDLEGIAVLPWGDLAVSSEGDLNHKPRVNPQIFSISKAGVIQKEYEIPAPFLAEGSGQQKKGVQNNLAFEGMSLSPNGKSLWLATEAPLFQDLESPSQSQDRVDQAKASPKFVRFLEYNFPDAFVMKFVRELKYPLQEEPGELQRGISEILIWSERSCLVLERSVQLTSKGIEFKVEIFQTDLNEKSTNGLLKKKKIFDFSELRDRLGKIDNFEGMARGPRLAEGKESLIFVSDDNFKSSQKTQFVLFEVKE